MIRSARRVTQQDIAKMTGVSQATVSLVLNGRAGETRIAPQTRDRVLRAIQRTGYVADPIARRLGARHNRIMGVFTYEPVFPSGSGDFYHPFLVGIEQAAEGIGCDLLLMTSAPVINGRRRLLNEESRFRLTDGCVLLGRSLDRAELSRLVADGHPFVSVGRRDDAGGPVPYVGANYSDATAALVRRAVKLGHRRLAYVGQGDRPAGGERAPESYADRMRGFASAVRGRAHHEAVGDRSSGQVLDGLLAAGVTAAFVEEYADGVTIASAAGERGLTIPGDLSILALGDPTRPITADLDLTGFRIPRRAMGWQAVELLHRLLDGKTGPIQRLLPCEPVDGSTLAPPATS